MQITEPVQLIAILTAAIVAVPWIIELEFKLRLGQRAKRRRGFDRSRKNRS